MRPWKRLYVVVEGPTEREFLKLVLADHLAEFEIDLRPRVTVTSHDRSKRGGVNFYKTFRRDLDLVMKEDPSSDAVFSTMIDLYALPPSFPGWNDAQGKPSLERAAVLEAALANDLNDTRLVPYIQVHEFEALLFCDLTELQKRIDGAETGISSLRREVDGLEPEDINAGVGTSPSKRIIKHVPIYNTSKLRVGAPAAAAIGLPKLRERCPRFHQWVEKLEALGATPK